MAVEDWLTLLSDRVMASVTRQVPIGGSLLWLAKNVAGRNKAEPRDCEKAGQAPRDQQPYHKKNAPAFIARGVINSLPSLNRPDRQPVAET
jgi:hypothetical protein